MRPEYVEEEKKKRDKRRGAIYTFLAHILILLIAFLPFLDKERDVEHFPRPIEIQFAGGSSQEGASASQAGDESADEMMEEAMESSEAIEEVVPEPVVESVPEPVTAPDPVTPVRTSTNAESIKMPDKPTVAKTKPKVDLNELKKPAPPLPKKSTEEPKPAGGSNTEKSNTSGSGNSSTPSKGSGGTGSTDGNDGKGKGTQGDGTDKTGSGKPGPGGIFEGIGPLKRAVVHRPNLKVLVKEEGVIAFDVCITRDGKVTQVVFDRKNSTIKDKESIQKTLDVANQFRFKEDNNAPALECGKLKIRITI